MRRRLRLAGAIAFLTAALAAEPAAAANNLGLPLPAIVGNGAQTITGDLDLDGNLDVASAGVNVRYGDGDGGFTSASYSTGELIPVGIASGDFNEDLRPDLVSTGFAVGASVLLSDPAGGFEAAATVPGSQTGGVATGDFDGDAHLDIAVNSSGVVRVFRGDGNGGFAAGIDFSGGSGAGALAAFDLDGNGRDDLIAGDVTADTVDVLLAKSGPLTTGPGGLEIFDAAVPHATAADPQRVLVTDLDGDGKRDLVVNGASLQALYGDGLGGFGAAVTVAAGPVADMAAGSFDGDAVTDLAIARSNQVSIVLGRADRAAAVGRSFASGFSAGLNRVTTGDFNEDTQLDVVADATAGSRLLPGETLRVPPLVGFPTVRVNQGIERPVSIVNTDAVPHTITGGDLLGGGEFDVVSEADDTCTDATLQPGGSCHVNVTFNAPTPGAATGVLAMDSDAGNSPHVTTLSARAVPVPILNVIVGPTAFGELQVGAQSAELQFVANNTSQDLPLHLSAPSLAGPDAAAFTVRDSCGNVNLVPAQGCRVFVRFRPTHQGPHTARLNFVNDGAFPDTSVGLSGTGSGEVPLPALTVSPAALRFGRVARGSGSSRSVVLESVGAAAVTLGEVRVSPPSSGFSARLAGCPLALAPGATCRVTVRFEPRRNGAHEASVFLSGPAPARFSVEGTGVAPEQEKPPLYARLVAGIDLWRDRGIEGLTRRGVRLKQLAVVRAGNTTLQLTFRRKGKAIVVAKGARRYDKAGTGEIHAEPTKRGKAALAEAQRVTVRARLRFWSDAARLTEVVKTFVLRRLERQASFGSCSESPARNRPSASPPPRRGCSPSG